MSEHDHQTPAPGPASPVVAVLALSTAVLALSVVFEKNLSPNGVSATLEAAWVLAVVAVAFGVVALLLTAGVVPRPRAPVRRLLDAVGSLQLVSFLAAAVLLVVLGFQLPGAPDGTPVPVGSAGAAAATTTTLSSVRGAPVIAGVRPAQGRVGTRIVIRGRGLLGVTRVVFAGASGAVSAESPTRIVTRVPAGARSGTISVSTSVGTGHSPGVFTVR